MKIIEVIKIDELVTRATTTDHLINRLNVAARLCDELGDAPLMFREFRTGMNYETVLAKVINRNDTESRTLQHVKGGVGKNGQIAILTKLGIENPVFTKMSPPDNTFGFHGDPHIFIPPPNTRAMWSPEIQDLGGQRLSGGKEIGRTLDGSLVTGVMAKGADEWVKTYVEGVPEQFTDHEVIFDCEYYYLLNIQSFLHRFSGRDNKFSLTSSAGFYKKIDPEVWSKRVRTYTDVANFLRNNGVSYVQWYQQNVENKPRGDTYPDPKGDTWEVKGPNRSIKVIATDEKEAIYKALNNAREVGKYGAFPRGREDILAVTKISEDVQQPEMDEKQGQLWERELMRSWGPKAAAHMAKVVKNSFNSLYPTVPIRVKRQDIFVMASTDPKADFSDELDIDVFNQRNNPNWECNFVVSPLFHMEDKTPYLELMVDDAASGQYKGVWKLIAQEWARFANRQLAKTGAKAAVFSVNEDHSDAWAAIAAQAGLKFIVHNR